MQTYTRTSNLPVSCQEAFAWHERPGGFERMLPPWENCKIIKKKGTVFNEDSIIVKVKLGIFSTVFKARLDNYIKDKQFEDTQVYGPFSFWRHNHSFEPVDETNCKINDCVKYKLPLSFISKFTVGLLIKNKLEKLFAFRHKTLIFDLKLHHMYSKKKLKILITGASGFVGHNLIPFLTTGGHEVIRLIRHSSANDDTNVVYWDSKEKTFKNTQLLENIDAVVHLAGENIAAKKWSDKRKNELIESRVQFTQDLCKALVTLKNPPKTFISASGIGIFGNRGDNILTDESKLGEGFLADLAQKWENASLQMKDVGTRVVHLRFGAIVSSGGGVLKKLLTPYKLFMGGPIGTGTQMMPWISMVDVLGLILFSLSNDKVEGALNAVSPCIVTNNQFSEMLAQALNRPNSLRVPEMMVELLFGEMGKELLLSGQHAKPTKVIELGYDFLQPHLHDCLTYFLP